ncbi:MAG: hypothetical protein U0641_03030 [Anaerolineae bacterium]
MDTPNDVPHVTIKRKDRTMVFAPTELEKIRTVASGKVRWDRRTNRWTALGELDELAELLTNAGYKVNLVGPKE